MGKLRIGLLSSASISESKSRSLEPILRDSRYEIVHCFVDDRPGLSFKKKFRKNLKRGRGGYMLVMAWKSFFKRRKTSPSRSIKNYCQDFSIPLSFWKTPIYSEEHLEEMRSKNLDLLILLGGFGIVRDKIISIPQKGVLSYHHGDMRKYRGMPPALWEVYNGETEMGVTVQLLDAGLDSGLPVREVKVPLHNQDDEHSAIRRATRLGEPLLAEALEFLYNNPQVEIKPIKKLGTIYTLPNLKQYFTLKWRIFSRRVNILIDKVSANFKSL